MGGGRGQFRRVLLWRRNDAEDRCTRIGFLVQAISIDQLNHRTIVVREGRGALTLESSTIPCPSVCKGGHVSQGCSVEKLCFGWPVGP